MEVFRFIRRSVLPATTAAATIGAGARFVDLERPSAEFEAVEGGDGGTGGLIVAHFDETETAGAAGFTIGDERHVVHFTVLAEQFVDFSFGRLKR
jgi:hypothetical protein